MRRIIYVLVACAVTLAIAWSLAGLPGQVTARFGATTVEMVTPIAILTLLVIFVVLYIVVRLVAGLLRLPRAAARWDTARDRRRGDAAVTRALLALAAGDKVDARREAGRARRLLGETPQTLLLAAEAGRLAGHDDEAEAAFRRLADRQDAAFLGYRGLLRQALDRQDFGRGCRPVPPRGSDPPRGGMAAPSAGTAGDPNRPLERGAGPRCDRYRPRRPRDGGGRGGDRGGRRGPAKLQQAWKADASLAPAALAWAGRLRADGREPRAQTVIRHSWTLAPHPDLAKFALAATNDPLAKARAAQELAEANPEHAESRLLLARTSLDAGLTGEARHHATLARDSGLNQRRLWLLLAEIEETEHGGTEEGRLAQRDALRRATEADADPEWRCTACHEPHPAWHAACASCGAPGSLRWLPGKTASYPAPAIVA